MEEINEVSQVNENFENFSLEQLLNNCLMIIKCLNDFESIVEKNPAFIKPLIITKYEKSFVFEQIKLKIQYIKQTLKKRIPLKNCL